MLTVIPHFKSNSENFENDEIVEVLQLFRRTDFDFLMLVLDQVPNLNLVLHEVDIPVERVWNIWDKIQDIHQPAGLPLSLDDLEIPEELSVFSGWPVMHLDDETGHRAEVDFHERGFITRIVEYAESGKKISHYDYRGFLSFTDWVDQNGELLKREWYDATGRVVMTQENGEIRIATDQLHRFEKDVYNNQEEILSEFLLRYFERRSVNDVLAHKSPLMTRLVEPSDLVRRVVYLSGYRQVVDSAQDFVIRSKDYYVSPTSDDQEMFLKRAKSIPENGRLKISERLRVIPLYPTELGLGVSNELPLMNIYWHWGDYPQRQAMELTARFLQILDKHDDFAVQAEVGKGTNIGELNDAWEQMVGAVYDVDIHSRLYLRIKQYITEVRSNMPSTLTKKQIKKLRKEELFDQIAAAVNLLFRFMAVKPQSRDGQNELISQARVYLDTGIVPDLRLQTASISAGIPQITQRPRGMLRDKINGKIAQSQPEIIAAVLHYLDELKPWNETVVENVRLLEQYQEETVAQAWEDFIYGTE